MSTRPVDLQIDAFLRTLAAQGREVLADARLAEGLLQVSGRRETGPQAAAVAWQAQLGSACATLRMIEAYVQPGAPLLEIGGGLGLSYAWLRQRGLDVTSLEPGLAGHPGSYELAQRLLSLLGVDGRDFLPRSAEQAPGLGRRFALIFSYNVLEHLADLPGTLRGLLTCLRAGGVMRHGCPNYRVPYEPHFGMPLPPLFPRVLARLRPSLQDDELWRRLNFVSAPTLQRWAQAQGVEVHFDREQAYHTFLRLEQEPSFADKHPQLFRLGRVLRRSGLLPVLRHLPPTWMTPMQVTFCRPDAV